MGYDETFLGTTVPLPRHPLDDLVLLDYEHFTIGQNIRRRLAAFTIVNIDGSALVELDRGDDWHLDERLEPDEQCGPELYARNDLDRGHLVRRRDPVWGSPEVARRANFDSFAYPNAAPQAAEFNQSKELWLGLEDHVLAFARVNRSRLTVMSAPVLADDDEPYRGVLIPRRFVKVAAWHDGEGLRSAGFVLDQSPLIDDLGPGVVATAPALGPFRTFQVPVVDVEGLTGLDLGPLAGADRTAGPRAAPAEWRELTGVDDIRL